MDIHLYDIVKHKDEVVQVVAKRSYGLYIQDIHCNTTLIDHGLVDKYSIGTEDVNWFKENTTNENFVFIKVYSK